MTWRGCTTTCSIAPHARGSGPRRAGVGCDRGRGGNLRRSPFIYRRAGDDPFLREAAVPFGHSGYVALFEIENAATVTTLAVRHQLEDDHHWGGDRRRPPRRRASAAPPRHRGTDSPASWLANEDRRPAARCPAAARRQWLPRRGHASRRRPGGTRPGDDAPQRGEQPGGRAPVPRPATAGMACRPSRRSSTGPNALRCARHRGRADGAREGAEPAGIVEARARSRMPARRRPIRAGAADEVGHHQRDLLQLDAARPRARPKKAQIDISIVITSPPAPAPSEPPTKRRASSAALLPGPAAGSPAAPAGCPQQAAEQEDEGAPWSVAWPVCCLAIMRVGWSGELQQAGREARARANSGVLPGSSPSPDGRIRSRSATAACASAARCRMASATRSSIALMRHSSAMDLGSSLRAGISRLPPAPAPPARRPAARSSISWRTKSPPVRGGAGLVVAR